MNCHNALHLERLQCCINPTCDCNQVFLDFIEADSSNQPIENPLVFMVAVDLESWQENDPPSRTQEVAAWVQEFLDECPADTRARIREEYRDARQVLDQIAEFTMDSEKIEDGTLLPYPNIFADGGALSSGGTGYSFGFCHQGREYLIVDLYCPNPTCDCQDVHVEFFEVEESEDGKKCIDQRFIGVVKFAGKLSVEEAFTCSRAEAKAVLSAWWKEGQVSQKLLEQRYDVVKKIGDRSLRVAPLGKRIGSRVPGGSLSMSESMNEPLEKSVKVGRNDPCPCGSGKKHKKCCLRKGPLPF